MLGFFSLIFVRPNDLLYFFNVFFCDFNNTDRLMNSPKKTMVIIALIQLEKANIIDFSIIIFK